MNDPPNFNFNNMKNDLNFSRFPYFNSKSINNNKINKIIKESENNLNIKINSNIFNNNQIHIEQRRMSHLKFSKASKLNNEMINSSENHESSKNTLLNSNQPNSLIKIHKLNKNPSKIEILENKSLRKFSSNSIKNIQFQKSFKNNENTNYKFYDISPNEKDKNKINQNIYDLNISQKLISVGENNRNLFNIKTGNINNNISNNFFNRGEFDKEDIVQNNLNLLQENIKNKNNGFINLSKMKRKSLESNNNKFILEKLTNSIINFDNNMIKCSSQISHLENQNPNYIRNKEKRIKY